MMEGLRREDIETREQEMCCSPPKSTFHGTKFGSSWPAKSSEPTSLVLYLDSIAPVQRATPAMPTQLVQPDEVSQKSGLGSSIGA
jgi:hypothetical protein